MIELGKKAKLVGTERWKTLKVGKKPLHGKPEAFPNLEDGHKVIGVYDHGSGEEAAVCENLEEMQRLYEDRSFDGVLQINWYTAPTLG